MDKETKDKETEIKALQAEIENLKYRISMLNVQQSVDKGSINALRAEIENQEQRISGLEMQQMIDRDILYEEVVKIIREYYKDDIDRLLVTLRAEFRQKLKEKFNL